MPVTSSMCTRCTLDSRVSPRTRYGVQNNVSAMIWLERFKSTCWREKGRVQTRAMNNIEVVFPNLERRAVSSRKFMFPKVQTEVGQ